MIDGDTHHVVMWREGTAGALAWQAAWHDTAPYDADGSVLSAEVEVVCQVLSRWVQKKKLSSKISHIPGIFL